MNTCARCQANFDISPEDLAFYANIDVPAPNECPTCRQQHRILFRNFKTLYQATSAKSGKPMISMFSDSVPFPVWTNTEWWEDDWDAKNYGRDIDFSRPFFEQLKELSDSVPHYGIHNSQSTSCDYSNAVLQSTNCYLVFGCVNNENCSYGHIVWNSTDTVDGLYVFKSEYCYECTDVLNSYKLLHSRECDNCSESVGLFDCRDCTHCIGCVGLRHKNYHIFNKPVSKEEYARFLEKHPLHNKESIAYILKEQEKLRRTVPQKYFYGSHNNNVSGNHLYHAKNVHHSFDVKSGEDSKYIFTIRSTKDSHDLSFTADIEHSYFTLTGIGSNIFFSHFAVNSNDIYYSQNCYSSNDLFGCEGLKKAQYCILNKQYSKEEYEETKTKLIDHMKETGEWGNFFPRSMSPFGYNESIINEYYPLTKEEALKKGYTWEENIPRTKDQETIPLNELPANPRLYSSDLLNEVLKCEECGFNYRLIAKEIEFYKELGVPLPHSCFNCRHARRMNDRNQRTLHDGSCAKCNTDFKTSYTKEQQNTYLIYCESCYNQEIA